MSLTEPGGEERLAELRNRKKSLTPSEAQILKKLEVEKQELEEQATRIQATFRGKKGRKMAQQTQHQRDSAAATKIQSIRRQQQARRTIEAERLARRRATLTAKTADEDQREFPCPRCSMEPRDAWNKPGHWHFNVEKRWLHIVMNYNLLVTQKPVIHDYDPRLYFADCSIGSGGTTSLPLLPKLKVFQGDCVDILDHQGDMVKGLLGEKQGWFPAACVGLSAASYSKEANRLPPELSLVTKSLPQIRREVRLRKEREARAAEEARLKRERREAEIAAAKQAEREAAAERRATLMGGDCFSLGGPPRLTAFFSDQRTTLAQIRQERVDVRARRGAHLAYRKQPWRM